MEAEKNWNYFVHNAYRICMNEIVGNSHLHVHGRCNLIWKLEVPLKVENFIWRMCRGCFPMRARLSRRGVSCPIDYVLCGSNYEDIIHVLLEYPKANQVWRDVNIWDNINMVVHQNYNIDALICTLLQQFSSTQS